MRHRPEQEKKAPPSVSIPLAQMKTTHSKEQQ